MDLDETTCIDAEIERRTHELAALKLRRNCLATIHRHLPPEVLSHVFLILRDSFWTLQKPYEWVLLTHVCHYWRELARSTAALWNHIQVRRSTKTEIVVEMLLRSQQAPLTVDLRVPYAKLSDFLESVVIIANHMYRIKHLRLWVPEDAAESGAFRAFHHFVRRAAHAKLESLFAWGQYESWIPSIKESQPLFCSTMQELCIRVRSSTNPLVVRTAIRDMPLLTSLELHFSRWDSMQEEPIVKCEPSEPIRLDKLQRIYLHGPPRTCAFLLDSVEFASTTSIHVRCPSSRFPSRQDETERFTPLMETLSSKINGVGGPTTRQRLSGLYIRKSGIRACTVIDGWSISHSAEILKTRPDGQSLHIVVPRGVAPQFCEAIRQALQNVQTLYLNESDNKDRWAELVRGMPNVREMIITGNTCSVLPRILGSDHRWNTGMSKHQLHGLLRSRPTMSHLQNLIIEVPPIAVRLGANPPSTSAIVEEGSLELPLLKRVLSARWHLSMGPSAIMIVSPLRSLLGDAFSAAGLTSPPTCEITFSTMPYTEYEDVNDREWDALFEHEYGYEDDENDEDEYGMGDEDTDVDEYWGYYPDGHYWISDSEEEEDGEEDSDDWIDEDENGDDEGSDDNEAF